MTEQEKIDVVMTVADAYAHRGFALQYNQLSMDRAVRITPRRRRGMSPETATEQHISFLDCSSFVWAVYKEAFGLEMRSDLTWYMVGMTEYLVFSYAPTHQETASERAAVLAEMRSVLQAGDIIVYAKGIGTSGHAMLYVGDDTILHCTAVDGGDYDYTNCRNRLSGTGGLRYDPVGILFVEPDGTPETRRSLFGADKKSFVVLRPLLKAGEPTANTLRRMAGCRKLDMAVLSDPAGGRNAAVGEEITYPVCRNNRVGIEHAVFPRAPFSVARARPAAATRPLRLDPLADHLPREAGDRLGEYHQLGERSAAVAGDVAVDRTAVRTKRAGREVLVRRDVEYMRATWRTFRSHRYHHRAVAVHRAVFISGGSVAGRGVTADLRPGIPSM